MDFFCNNQSRWLGKNCGLGDYSEKTPPAPWYRQDFTVTEHALYHCAVCGLGFYELFCNGKKVGDRLLDPVVSCYEKHVYYTVYDLSPYLRSGKNTLGIVLGGGWYNSSPDDIWNFQKAVWRDYPKFRLEVREAGTGKLILGSTPDWQTADGPILFDALRNGEFYDARKEFSADWCLPERTNQADNRWVPSELTQPPGGELIQGEYTPVKLLSTIHCQGPNLFSVYDAGFSLAGHCRIRVRGMRGDRIVIRYSDRIDRDGKLDRQDHSRFVFSGVVQQDEYTLKGESEEVWEPRFVYHGFRYIEIVPAAGTPEVLAVEARQVGTAMATHGAFVCDHPVLNRLAECFHRSFKSCFVGMPADNPHREKNGWTGDAHIACEGGLYCFDGRKIYDNFLGMLRDFQRPSGQIPGIVPCAGWGYNWGNGPAWDLALFEIPWRLWLHTGDRTELERCFPAMMRYCQYVLLMCSDGIVSWGIGDHLPPGRTAEAHYCSTACYQRILTITAFTAELLGEQEISAQLCKDMEARFNIFQRHYARGNGIYAGGEPTALALAAAFDLSADPEATAMELNRRMIANRCRADFGVLGAKYVPRVLLEHGFADTAFSILTQTEYPGWGYWMEQGATTLWERWTGGGSKNHVIYGDGAAVMFRYFAGFRHTAAHPGTSRLTIAPVFPEKLGSVKAEYCGYQVAWKKTGEALLLHCTIPESCTAELLFAGETRLLTAGEYDFEKKQDAM